MPTAEEYEAKVRTHGWDELGKLREAIKRRDTPGWDAGKALEYAIIRAFELDGATVRWPYPVSLFGEEVEQIDGSVGYAGLYCLVESKDEEDDIAIAPLSTRRSLRLDFKLQPGQERRRPTQNAKIPRQRLTAANAGAVQIANGGSLLDREFWRSQEKRTGSAKSRRRFAAPRVVLATILSSVVVL